MTWTHIGQGVIRDENNMLVAVVQGAHGDHQNVVGMKRAALIAQAPQLVQELQYLHDCAENGDAISDADWRRVAALIVAAGGGQ